MTFPPQHGLTLCLTLVTRSYSFGLTPVTRSYSGRDSTGHILYSPYLLQVLQRSFFTYFRGGAILWFSASPSDAKRPHSLTPTYSASTAKVLSPLPISLPSCLFLFCFHLHTNGATVDPAGCTTATDAPNSASWTNQPRWRDLQGLVAHPITG